MLYPSIGVGVLGIDGSGILIDGEGVGVTAGAGFWSAGKAGNRATGVSSLGRQKINKSATSDKSTLVNMCKCQ